MFRLQRFFGPGWSASTEPNRSNSPDVNPTSTSEGALSRLFDGIDYLTLLNLPPAASSAVLFIANVIGQNPNHRESVLALLHDPNWRLHLIAAVAVLLSPDRTVLCPALWEALDSGSWVAPQLAVVLSICDQQFVRGAKQRILAGCPVAPVRVTSPLEQHVVAGPGASPVRSGKNLAALVYLVRTIPDETQWAEAVGQTPEVAQVLQSDRDAGDKLAAYWAAALRERFAELGLSLLQPAF
jgi:hypothetical protein